ncbi:MAG: hypothetical protein WCJ17_02700 [bacterium]
MKKLLLIALWVGIAPMELKPAESATSPETKGQAFIRDVSVSLQSIKSLLIQDRHTMFRALIHKNFILYATTHIKHRQEKKLPFLSETEFIHSFFPSPCSLELPREVIQLFILYITYLLISNENPCEVVSESYSKVIEEYVLRYELKDWVLQTLEPCIPGIVTFIMPSDTTAPTEGYTSSSDAFNTTDEEIAFYFNCSTGPHQH